MGVRMTEITIRDAGIRMQWRTDPKRFMHNDSGENAMRTALGLAMVNLTGEQSVSWSLPVTIAVDGVNTQDWRIARLMVKPPSVSEVLFISQSFSDGGSAIGADYILVEMGDDSRWGGREINKVASVVREDDGALHCWGGPGDVWEEEWDEVLVKLREYRQRDE
jgi:hypothetical protein